MRTTLDVDDDVLQAAKEIAERDHTTAGKVISRLVRKSLSSPSESSSTYIMKNGIPVFPATGEIVTLEKVQQIMDEEGI